MKMKIENENENTVMNKHFC